jgi:hypothetical protein
MLTHSGSTQHQWRVGLYSMTCVSLCYILSLYAWMAENAVASVEAYWVDGVLD